MTKLVPDSSGYGLYKLEAIFSQQKKNYCKRHVFTQHLQQLFNN